MCVSFQGQKCKKEKKLRLVAIFIPHIQNVMKQKAVMYTGIIYNKSLDGNNIAEGPHYKSILWYKYRRCYCIHTIYKKRFSQVLSSVLARPLDLETSLIARFEGLRTGTTEIPPQKVCTGILPPPPKFTCTEIYARFPPAPPMNNDRSLTTRANNVPKLRIQLVDV